MKMIKFENKLYESGLFLQGTSQDSSNGSVESLWKKKPRKCVKNGFWNVGLRIVSSMNSAGIRWFYCLCLKTLEVQLPRKREVTVMDEAVLAPADQEERACGLREGLAGALPKVKCKLWVNDLIPIIPMCTFCNTSLVCVEKREGIFYGCSSSTSGRRLSVLNALRWREWGYLLCLHEFN